MKLLLKFTLGIGLLSGLAFTIPGSPNTLVNHKAMVKEEVAPFRAGDIIFISNSSGQGKAIQLATKSKYTHVGIILNDNGNLMVYHAVEPVKKNTIAEFLEYSADGRYELMRLKDPSVLTDAVQKKLTALATAQLGKHYDLAFSWDDKQLYCSEYVWKIYKEATGLELGALKPLGSFDLSHPAVQAKLKERYGNDIPLKENMIAPGDMHDSPLLTKVN